MECLTCFLLFLFCLLEIFHGEVLGDFSDFSKTERDCLVTNCLQETEECASNEECQDAVSCDISCFDAWEEDQTPEKYHVQNCSNVCAFSHTTNSFGEFMSCASDHDCLDLPSIPSHCRAPANLTLLSEELDVSSVLPGWWWQVRGYHQIYDCYDCPHIFFQQLNSTTWDYAPTYQVILEDGTTELVDQQFQWHVLDPAPGPEISVVFYYMGFTHYETWWLLDAAQDLSYVLVYYCGSSLQWHFEGAAVLAREKSLSAADYDEIANSFSEAIGLDLNEFCFTRTSDCPD